MTEAILCTFLLIRQKGGQVEKYQKIKTLLRQADCSGQAENKFLKQFPFTFLSPASECGINSRKVTPACPAGRKEACTEKERKKCFTVLFLTQEKNQKNMHLKRIAKIFFPLHCNKITRPDCIFKQLRDSNRFCCGHYVTRKFFNYAKRRVDAILLMCGEEGLKQIFLFHASLQIIFLRNLFKVGGFNAIYLRSRIVRGGEF